MTTSPFRKNNQKQTALPLVLLFFVVCLLFFFSCSDRKIITKAGKSILPKACVSCHGSETTYAVLGSRAGYDTSGHKNLGNSYYANGGDCQKCHTSEGFIKYIDRGSIDTESFIMHPSQIDCFTCHMPHESDDFSLRTDLSLALTSGKVFDYGKGNLCAQCHQALGTGKDIVREMPANKVMPYWGSHHGPQADMIVGAGAYEYKGKSYSSTIHSRIVQDGCITCHMTLPEGRYGLTAAIGGHSFNMAGEVHHSPALNTAGCLTCHQEVKQKVIRENGVRMAVFDINADDDFDQDGKLETVQEEIIGLMAKLVNKEGSGYLQKLPIPFYNENGDFVMTRHETQRTVTEMAALFNYKFILEDRSIGFHNITYTIQILYDTIESLDSDFNSSLRPN